MNLYRKYRPIVFGGIFGQDHIVKTLENQIKTKNLSHAYLFTGTRGTGKTSTAKVFARALNCTGDTPPCNNCYICATILKNQSTGVIEIDAASNNGVDNIRNLTEDVRYPPAEGSYKVYIIDEVHMLSAGAFNALLKTLEEPPKFVVFILATTDPQKVPPTVLSRCQRFDFRRISPQVFTERVLPIIEKENIEIEPEALDIITNLADGSARDGLSLIDQVSSLCYNEKITAKKVRDVFGMADEEIFFELVQALTEKNIALAMEIIERVNDQGKDFNYLVRGFTDHCRNLLVSKLTKDPVLSKFKDQALSCRSSDIIRYIEEFSNLALRIKNETNQRILFELCCIKLCLKDEEYQKEQERKHEKEYKKEEKPVTKSTNFPPPKSPVSEEQEKAPGKIPQKVQEISQLTGWQEFVKEQEPLTKVLLNKCTIKEEGNVLYVLANLVDLNLIKQKEDRIKQAFKEKFPEKELRFAEREENALTSEEENRIKEKINMEIKIV